VGCIIGLGCIVRVAHRVVYKHQPAAKEKTPGIADGLALDPIPPTHLLATLHFTRPLHIRCQFIRHETNQTSSGFISYKAKGISYRPHSVRVGCGRWRYGRYIWWVVCIIVSASDSSHRSSSGQVHSHQGEHIVCISSDDLFFENSARCATEQVAHTAI